MKKQEVIAMNEVYENMLTRRSIRKYQAKQVPENVIARILEAGSYAANGKGQQEVIMIAITKKEIRDKLAADNCKIGGWDEGFDPFYGALDLIVVLGNKNHTTRVYDGSCVMENLMLAAHQEGIGSCWIHRAKEEFEMPQWKEWLRSLGVEGEYEGIGHCILGYAEGEEPVPAPRKEHRIYWVQ